MPVRFVNRTRTIMRETVCFFFFFRRQKNVLLKKKKKSYGPVNRSSKTRVCIYIYIRLSVFHLRVRNSRDCVFKRALEYDNYIIDCRFDASGLRDRIFGIFLPQEVGGKKTR